MKQRRVSSAQPIRDKLPFAEMFVVREDCSDCSSEGQELLEEDCETEDRSATTRDLMTSRFAQDSNLSAIQDMVTRLKEIKEPQ